MTATVGEAARVLRAFLRMPEGEPRIWMYAFQAGEDGPVKFGISSDPEERLRTLQQAHYETLRPIASWLGSRSQERNVQALFAEHRLRGEWYAPSDGVLGFCGWIGHRYEDWDLRYHPAGPIVLSPEELEEIFGEEVA